MLNIYLVSEKYKLNSVIQQLFLEYYFVVGFEASTMGETKHKTQVKQE